ncbi:MAG: 60S ribosomal protein L38 [Amphiamblys sp. WSBS2006]|nr:MAG: 60S ribosomal protein L38 [Amphiamblys sp. WSBS2006]
MAREIKTVEEFLAMFGKMNVKRVEIVKTTKGQTKFRARTRRALLTLVVSSEAEAKSVAGKIPGSVEKTERVAVRRVMGKHRHL